MPLTTLSGSQRTRYRPCSSTYGFGASAELHVERDLRAHDLPGVAEAQPLVGQLHLPAVANRLIEDAELVADAVADGGNVEGRQRVHVTGGQPSEPAVAEARLLFLLQECRTDPVRRRTAPAAPPPRCRG